MQVIMDRIRDVPDFPQPGIVFKDITPLLQDTAAFRHTLDLLEERYRPKDLAAIAAVESRGLIFGGALADRLGVGLTILRKPGKLPYRTVSASYELEYGTDSIEMHVDGVEKGSRVLVLDDLLATGGTASAAIELIEGRGGVVVEVAFVIELAFLKGRERLDPHEVFSLVRYD